MAKKTKKPVRIDTQRYGRRVGRIGGTVQHKDKDNVVHSFDRRTGKLLSSTNDTWNRYGAGGGRGSKGGKSADSNE